MRMDDLEKTIGTQKQMIEMLNNMVSSQKLVIDMMMSRINALENMKQQQPIAPEIVPVTVDNTAQSPEPSSDILPLTRRVIL